MEQNFNIFKNTETGKHNLLTFFFCYNSSNICYIFVERLYTIGVFLKILAKFFLDLCMEIIFSYIRLPIS